MSFRWAGAASLVASLLGAVACGSGDSSSGSSPPPSDAGPSSEGAVQADGGGRGPDSATRDAVGGGDTGRGGQDSGPCTDSCPAPNGGVTFGCEKRFLYG